MRIFYRDRLVPAILLLLFVVATPKLCRASNFKYDSCDETDVGEGTCLVDLSNTGPIKVIVHGTKTDPFWQQVHAGMQQTAKDMKLDLEMQLFDETDPFYRYSTPTLSMVEELQKYQVYANGNGNGNPSAGDSSLPRIPAAMIVSLPGNPKVREQIATLQNSNIPIFGINAIGNDTDGENGLLQGTVSMSEVDAGVLAGNQIRELLLAKTTNTTNSTHGIYINHQSEVDSLTERFDALSTTTKDCVDSWEVVQVDKTTTDQEYMAFFEGCQQTVIQLAGGSGIIDSVLAALVANGCNIEQDHVVGTFDTSTSLIYDAMNEGTIKFAISQQPYLQGSNAVLLAALYATTGQKLKSASASSNVNTGPILVTPDNENFPTLEQQSCEIDGFPVCSPDSSDAISSRCPCTDRSKISIAVITHEDSSGFWDVVYSGISQAAIDFGVSIQKNEFQKASLTDGDMLHRRNPLVSRLQHTFDISVACTSKDIDGLIASLPDTTMRTALGRCTNNGIPYLAMNAVAGFQDNFGSENDAVSPDSSVLQYVGQKDYESGLEAGKRLLNAGVQQGWCLVHANFDTLLDRCRGMEAAFSEAKIADDQIDFAGVVTVPGNGDVDLYIETVEKRIRDYNGNGDTSGVGLLSTGKVQIPALLSLLERYPEMLAGTYDLDSSLYSSENTLLDQIVFGIDQNAYMEGYLSVATMVWRISTKEASTTTILETGPNFVAHVDTSAIIESRPDCQNKDIKFCGAANPLEPQEAASPAVDEGEPLKLSGKCKDLGRKCNVCEGDCDEDSDCGDGLVCFIRDSKTKGQSEQPPGCSTNPYEWSAKDFCVDAKLYQCKDVDWIDVRVGTNSVKRTCQYVADDLSNRCNEFGRFCRETCGYCRTKKDD